MNQVIEHNADQLPSAQPDSTTVLSIISKAASDPTVDIEKLERLMQLHERMQARNAQEQFNAAMAEMQCEIPTIAERAKGHGTIRYATLEDISDVVKPIMKAHGFAISFKVEHAQAGLSVTGILMHRAGHREETTMLLPLDTSGSKNAVQAVGSTTSYGKRYVMCALLNITTRGEDDDAYSAAPSTQEPTITDIQVRQLQALLGKVSPKAKANFEKVCPDIYAIPRSQFDGLLNGLTKSAQNNVQKEGDQ
jgi:hypothetical protein